jgi:MFS family permease
LPGRAICTMPWKRWPESAARRSLRRLVELDRPVPQFSEEEHQALVERHYRWNYAINLVEGIAFWLSLSFLSASTIVPLFISKLTSGTVAIGLAAMLAQGGWYLPQLVSANWIERLPRRKPVVVNFGLWLDVLPAWLLVIAALMAGRWARLALVLFLLFYAWRYLGSGMVATAWQDLIARVIPTTRRGGFWGLTSAIGTVVGLGASATSAWLLAFYAFSANFVIIFGLAALTNTFAWFSLSLTREVAQPVTSPRQSQRQYLANLRPLLRQDAPFRRFLVARALLGLAGMGLAFVAVAAVQHWEVSDATVGIYTAVLILGQGLGSLVFGTLADRHGHKLSLEGAAALYALAFALAWLAPAVGWYYVAFAFLGASYGAQMNSGILMVLEFAEPKRRPTYIGVAGTLLGLVSMAAPLLGAWLAGIDYGLLFAASAAISLVAWGAMHWGVQEPRQRVRAESL